jgi:hypothetical protein
VAVWVAGALVATATGLVAVRLVADRVGETAPPPLSAAGVETELGAATATPDPTTSPSASPLPGPPSPIAPPATTSVPVAPAPAGGTRSFSGRGGSIGVSCDGGTPRLVYATPSQGWAVDENRVEGARLEVRFKADGVGESRIRATCAAAGPTATVEDDGGSGSGKDDDVDVESDDDD